MAVKVALTKSEAIQMTFAREVSVLKFLGIHPNIVPLREAVDSAGGVPLAFARCDCSLLEYAAKTIGETPLPLDLVKDIAWQTCAGIAYCHSRRVVHRDLKLFTNRQLGGTCNEGTAVCYTYNTGLGRFSGRCFYGGRPIRLGPVGNWNLFRVEEFFFKGMG